MAISPPPSPPSIVAPSPSPPCHSIFSPSRTVSAKNWPVLKNLKTHRHRTIPCLLQRPPPLGPPRISSHPILHVHSVAWRYTDRGLLGGVLLLYVRHNIIANLNLATNSSSFPIQFNFSVASAHRPRQPISARLNPHFLLAPKIPPLGLSARPTITTQ